MQKCPSASRQDQNTLTAAWLWGAAQEGMASMRQTFRWLAAASPAGPAPTIMTLPTTLAGFCFAGFLPGDFISPLMNFVTCAPQHRDVRKMELTVCNLALCAVVVCHNRSARRAVGLLHSTDSGLAAQYRQQMQ